MGRVCMVRDLVAELVMGQVCYGPSLSWAEFVMGQDVPESLNWHTFQNQACVYRKSKIRKWKKLNDSVLINYLITLFTTIILR